jgi:putative PIN family toxin of toxin-antitoxin system
VLVRVVIDTSVFVASVMASENAARAVVRLCLLREIEPLMGNALFLEYESVLGRAHLFANSPIDRRMREELFDAFLSVCRWTLIYYLWRPNLQDEADNHLVELAVAGNARYIVTHNRRDLASSELSFPGVEAIDDRGFLANWEKMK